MYSTLGPTRQECALRSGMDLGSCVLFQILQLYSTRCFDFANLPCILGFVLRTCRHGEVWLSSPQSPSARSPGSANLSQSINTLCLEQAPALQEGLAFECINTPTAPHTADATEQCINPISTYPPEYFFPLRDLTPLQQLQYGPSPRKLQSLAS
jgi:hypothetical protein